MFRSIKTLLAAATFSVVASASTITIATPGGATETGGNPVNASATFTTSANTVTIDLFNLLTAAQMSTVAQAISDLTFTLSGSFGAVTDANRTYSGQLITVGDNGAVTLVSGTFNGWDFSGSGSTYTLEDLGSAAGPAQTILGGTAGSLLPYCGGQCGSIINNAPHNPFLQGTAHFVLTIAGVSSTTNVTGATFSFGTELGNNVPGGNVPEPITSALVGTGLLSLAFLRLRKAAK